MSGSEAMRPFTVEALPLLWRMQDREGRGPYRPGFTHKWADESGPSQFPPFYVEMGWAPASVPDRLPRGYHCGCATRSRELLFQWFTPSERMRLGIQGFRVVRVQPDIIVAETPSQVLFGCFQPLAAVALPVGGEQPSTTDSNRAPGTN